MQRQRPSTHAETRLALVLVLVKKSCSLGCFRAHDKNTDVQNLINKF
jgi:hypothetical protein